MKIDFSGFGNGCEADLHFQWPTMMTNSRDGQQFHWHLLLSIFVFRLVIYKVRLHFSTLAKCYWPNIQIDLFDRMCCHRHHRRRQCHCRRSEPMYSMPSPVARHHFHHNSFDSVRVLMADSEAAAPAQMMAGCNDLCNMFEVECVSVRVAQFHLLFAFRHSVSNTAEAINHWMADEQSESVDMLTALMELSHLNFCAKLFCCRWAQLWKWLLSNRHHHHHRHLHNARAVLLLASSTILSTIDRPMRITVLFVSANGLDYNSS